MRGINPRFRFISNATIVKSDITTGTASMLSKYCKIDGSPYIQGVAKKKVATHKKWVTWFIIAINEENVNESYVFVLA